MEGRDEGRHGNGEHSQESREQIEVRREVGNLSVYVVLPCPAIFTSQLFF